MGAKRKVGRRSSGREGTGRRDGAGDPPTSRRYTPEQRREAVEAWRASGVPQAMFARQWGVSSSTLSVWARQEASGGPKALERPATKGGRGRGAAPVAEAVKAEVAATKRRFPEFGLKRVRDWVRRFSGLSVSVGSVRKVLTEEALPIGAPLKRRRRAAPPRRFERARPGELWQVDITYLHVPWQRGPLYLIALMDDFSRFVVGWGLHTHQRADIALDVFREAIGRHPKPKELLSDQGRQFFSWRGRSEFQKMLQREGVKHVVARAQHPETVGKLERLWETVKRELWDRVHPRDLEEARERLQHYFSHYNFQRPSQALEGMVPADRYFGVASEVRQAIEAQVARNAIRLALGERPRKPVFLVGQVDGQTVSVHGEEGRVVVQTPDGAVKAIESKDLGIEPRKEASDGEEHGDDEGDGSATGRAAPPGGGGGPAEAAGGLEAHEVPGAAADAGAGAGAVGVGERGGAGAGAPDGDGGTQDLAGEDEP